MEIIIILGTLILPIVVILLLAIIGRKYTKVTQQKEQLVDTMENIIQMKNKMIKQLKSLNPF